MAKETGQLIRIIVVIVGIIIVSIPGFGQSDFTVIDKQSEVVPGSLTDYEAIAEYLTNGLKTDKEKARAIYIWITHNIEYDLTQTNVYKRYYSSRDIINEVLTTRKGVCQHYSELFLAMSKSVGLESYLISGYTRNVFGEIADLSHVWNGIKIDSDYYLIDVTWAAGYKLNGKYVNEFRDYYFLKPPKDFIKDHMPFDPIWQFLDNPVNNYDFMSRDFSKLDITGYFAYDDSIKQHERSDELTQLENANRRTIENGVDNELVQKQVEENILQITNRKYNIAIDTLNYGVKNYNLYITYKNRQFQNPKIEDPRIKKLIDNAGNGIYAANDILDGLSSADNNLNDMIKDARNGMSGLINDLEQEKDFVDRYLKKRKPLRAFMFLSYEY